MRFEDVMRSSGSFCEPDWPFAASAACIAENMIPLSWSTAATPEVLLADAERFVMRLGFAHIAYLLNSSLPLSAPQRLWIGNLPVACEDGDIESALALLVQRCRATLRPVVWDDTVFEAAPAFRAALRDAGVRSGWSQIVRGSQGKWGVFTAFRNAAPPSADELCEIEPRLVWLAQIFHHHLVDACPLRYADKGDVKLTELEKNILRWTIDGKTSGELAEILELSTRTVNFHVQNILAKLNVRNKTSAAAQAALLELLS